MLKMEYGKKDLIPESPFILQDGIYRLNEDVLYKILSQGACVLSPCL